MPILMPFFLVFIKNYGFHVCFSYFSHFKILISLSIFTFGTLFSIWETNWEVLLLTKLWKLCLPWSFWSQLTLCRLCRFTIAAVYVFHIIFKCTFWHIKEWQFRVIYVIIKVKQIMNVVHWEVWTIKTSCIFHKPQ